MTDKITLALSKGRILDDTLPLLKSIGIIPEDDYGRKLIISTNIANVKILIVRATDVPTYVEYGAADMGVAGKDILMEYSDDDGLYEPIDLGIAKCRMCTAGLKDAQQPEGRLRIATKYVKIAKRYFAQKGQQVDVIKLYGSMELAPLLGLAHQIVDLVDTGNTLKANGLVEMEHIADISSRLIVNKASMKTKTKAVKDIMQKISKVVQAKR